MASQIQQALLLGVVLLIFVNFGDAQRSRSWGLLRRFPFFYSIDVNDIAFYLYPDTGNEDYRERIEISNGTALAQSSYNTSRPLVILIHGIMASPSTITDVINIKNTYLAVKFEANIVMVDHSALQDARIPQIIPFANTLFSTAALLNTYRTGKKVADFVKFLVNEKVLVGPEAVHIIGLSNGGHIAGHAGEMITKNWPGHPKIGRISGLDTMGGQFSQNLLDASDASFVDITYTAYSYSGYFGRAGHVDFYMNGIGLHQPNCRNGFPFTEPYCTHISSVYYFAKSIRNKNMVGCKCAINGCRVAPPECKDKIPYGQNVPSSARGDYYVQVLNYQSTRSKSTRRTPKPVVIFGRADIDWEDIPQLTARTTTSRNTSRTSTTEIPKLLSNGTATTRVPTSTSTTTTSTKIPSTIKTTTTRIPTSIITTTASSTTTTTNIPSTIKTPIPIISHPIPTHAIFATSPPRTTPIPIESLITSIDERTNIPTPRHLVFIPSSTQFNK